MNGLGLMIYLCGMFIFVTIVTITIAVIVYIHIHNERNRYAEEVALQKMRTPVVLQDANAIKVRYRMNLMDTFIRKTFRQVKTWKSLGDERAFHPMFFDNNWKGHHNVEIQMLDGTIITQMIMIDPKTDTLSLPPVKDKPEENSAEVEAKKHEEEIKKAANEFLQRKDVIKILTEEKNAVVSENLPSQEVYDLCYHYLGEEHGVQLYQTKNGWHFSFT